MNRIELEKTYWEKEANGGDVDRAVCDPGLDEVCINNLKWPIEGNVLEVGCGVGRLLRLLPYMPDGLTHYYGIDISKSMIEECKKRLFYRKDIKVRQSDGRTVPFPNETFDYVYSVAVFQHIDDEGLRQYFKEIYRVLTATGEFRFQFVIGTEKTAFSWQRTTNEIAVMLSLVGFRQWDIEEGFGFDCWGWVTARKFIKEVK